MATIASPVPVPSQARPGHPDTGRAAALAIIAEFGRDVAAEILSECRPSNSLARRIATAMESLP
jgi:hypothetical protein